MKTPIKLSSTFSLNNVRHAKNTIQTCEKTIRTRLRASSPAYLTSHLLRKHAIAGPISKAITANTVTRPRPSTIASRPNLTPQKGSSWYFWFSLWHSASPGVSQDDVYCCFTQVGRGAALAAVRGVAHEWSMVCPHDLIWSFLCTIYGRGRSGSPSLPRRYYVTADLCTNLIWKALLLAQQELSRYGHAY